MKTIDPYYEWLGIPPKHQPPDHYRLLGLDLFEDDRNVIATAADRQMSFIKNYQTGRPETEELSQRILNELAAARICLLNSEKKNAYDRGLRAELERKQADGVVSKESPVPAIAVPVIGIHPHPQQPPRSPTRATDATLSGTATAESPLPRRPQIRRASSDHSEEPKIVTIAIGAGIGCILLAGLLIVSFAMRSRRSSPAGQQPSMVAKSIVAVEEDHAVEESLAEPDPFELRPVEEPDESAAMPVPTECDVQNRVPEPSPEPPDVQPIPAADSEASSSAVEETLEQAEQRLILEAARASTDSAREKFVREVLTVTDRAIVDSRAELARRLTDLALKVARGSDSPKLIQSVTLRLIEVRGPPTETLKQEARQRLDQP